MDISHMVNNPTALAGVTEKESYMNKFNNGDRALSVFLRPFGEANGPVLRFASYNLNKKGDDQSVNIDIALDADEVDGSWNWIYFGYSATE